MRCTFIAILTALTLVASAPSTRAYEFGTRAEAMAMVKRAQAKYNKDGFDVLVRTINSRAKEFNDRDLYVFIVDFKGRNYADAATPAITGQNIWDIKDQDGKFVVQNMVALAKDKGQGWVDYRWINPATKTFEDKSAYVERLGGTADFFVACGIYKNEQPNENTIGLISGSPNSDDTYLQMAHDLADVLNDGDNLRILPISGIGGPRNIRDVRYLKGVDVGLTQTSILNNFRRSNERMGQTENKIAYIAKLFNEEVHLVARPTITSITQLNGLKVNLDARGSGTSYSMRDIFNALNIEIEEVSMSQAEAFEKVKSGEIAATVLIGGKPVRSMTKLGRADGLHFVPIPYDQPLLADYLPATLTPADYPELIPAGQSVETVAVGAVLIAYNWPKTNVDRYRRVERFVDAFFSKADELMKPPRHPKWREVNIAAILAGWPRFDAAQAWLDAHHRGNAADVRPQPPQTVAPQPPQAVAASGSTRSAAEIISQDPALFQEFLRWRQMRQTR
jgi:TRAP-type uncharacterized transport system substrate-binding protein